MQDQSNELEFSRVVETVGLRPTGEEVNFEANATELECIAERLGLIEVFELKVQLKLEPWRKGGWHVTGTAQTEIEQVCVVTAEFFRSTCALEIDRHFMHEKDNLNQSAEIVIDPLSDDEPDVIAGGQIVLGELVVEDLALSLDPYPRVTGADFAAIQSGDADDAAETKPNPFAVLAKLQRPD